MLVKKHRKPKDREHELCIFLGSRPRSTIFGSIRRRGEREEEERQRNSRAGSEREGEKEM